MLGICTSPGLAIQTSALGLPRLTGRLWEVVWSRCVARGDSEESQRLRVSYISVYVPDGVLGMRCQDSRHLWPHSTQVNSRTSQEPPGFGIIS